jgi:hypothetical protein
VTAVRPAASAAVGSAPGDPTDPDRHRRRLPQPGVLACADEHHITAADLATGEVLSLHLIEPDKSYWRNKTKEPGRWPSSET